MAIKKLRKRKVGSSPVKQVSKSFDVKDVEGNKHILKATVVTVDESKVKKSHSDEMIEDRLEHLGLSSKVVRPPLDQAQLSYLWENSGELGSIVDQMTLGISGFGGRLMERKMTEQTREKYKSAIEAERVQLETLLAIPNPEGTFTTLRKETRTDLENMGNAWWELIPTRVRNGKYSCINKMTASEMFWTKPDKRFTQFSVKFVDNNLQLQERRFVKRFRRVVQILGNKKMFFKEMGDPRCIDKRTGDVGDPKKLPKKYWANEVYHWKLYAARRTPYGMPRYTGNIIAIRGSRSADETNILTQQNNHVPSMAIMVSGGQLTQGSVDRIKEFVDSQIKHNSNYSKFLIIEGESTHDSLSGPGSVKVEIEQLTNSQHSDQLWQDYDKNNADKVRRSFRMPPILIGKTDDYSKASAQVSERLAEKYVFNPEREVEDLQINHIMMHQGFKFHTFKSNSPNVTDDQDLVRILTGAERTGGLTPRLSRSLLSDIMNEDLEAKFPFPDKEESGFDPDLPFSYTLAQLMHSAGAANQNSSFASQGQTPKAPKANGRPPKEESSAEKVKRTFDPVGFIHDLAEGVKEMKQEEIAELSQLIEDSLDDEAFGSVQRDYFKHEH